MISQAGCEADASVAANAIMAARVLPGASICTTGVGSIFHPRGDLDRMVVRAF